MIYGNGLDSLIRMLGIVFSGKISSSDKKNYLKNDYGIKISMEDERRLDLCVTYQRVFGRLAEKKV